MEAAANVWEPLCDYHGQEFSHLFLCLQKEQKTHLLSDNRSVYMTINRISKQQLLTYKFSFLLILQQNVSQDSIMLIVSALPHALHRD